MTFGNVEGRADGSDETVDPVDAAEGATMIDVGTHIDVPDSVIVGVTVGAFVIVAEEGTDVTDAGRDVET